MQEGQVDTPLAAGFILEVGRVRLRVKRPPTKEEFEIMFGPDVAFLWDIYGKCDPRELRGDETKDLHILARAIFEEVPDEQPRRRRATPIRR